MPEHEWKQGDAVWGWFSWGACWLTGVVYAGDPATRRAYITSEEHMDECPGLWFAYADLRPRNPATNGKDKPTAESEARR